MTIIAAPAFLAALVATPPGGTFAPVGEIANVDVKGLTFAEPIIVDLTGATLTRIGLTKCAGIHFRGGAWSPAAVKEQVLISGCDDISFDGTQMLADSKAYGFRLVDSSHITIKNCRTDRAFQGINVGRCKFVDILTNFIIGFNNDGVVLVNVEDVLVQDSVITGGLRTTTQHPDGIQIDAKDGMTNARVKIIHNYVLGLMQGIFGGPVDDIEVRDNVVCVDHSAGIRVGGTKIAVTGNWVSTWPVANQITTINVDAANVVERSGNVREAWGKVAALVETPVAADPRVPELEAMLAAVRKAVA